MTTLAQFTHLAYTKPAPETTGVGLGGLNITRRTRRHFYQFGGFLRP